MLIPVLFSRYELFFFRQTSIPWDTQKRRSPQILETTCPLLHVTSTEWAWKYFVIHPTLHGIKKTFENFLALNFLLQEFKYPCFSKILVVPIPFYMWRQKLKNLLDFSRAWKPTPHLVPLYGSTHVLSSSVNVILDTLFVS